MHDVVFAGASTLHTVTWIIICCMVIGWWDEQHITLWRYLHWIFCKKEPKVFIAGNKTLETILAKGIYDEYEGQESDVMTLWIISLLQGKQVKPESQFTMACSIRCCYKICSIVDNTNGGSLHSVCTELLLPAVLIHCMFTFLCIGGQKDCLCLFHCVLPLVSQQPNTQIWAVWVSGLSSIRISCLPSLDIPLTLCLCPLQPAHWETWPQPTSLNLQPSR